MIPIQFQIRIRIQGFYDQKVKKIYSWKYIYIFFLNCKFLSLEHEARLSCKRSLKPSKEKSTSKHDISPLFSLFVGHFCPPRSRSGSMQIWIPIHNTVHDQGMNGRYRVPTQKDTCFHFSKINVEWWTCVSACEAVLHPSLAEGAHGALLRLQAGHHLQQAQVCRGGHTTSVADPGCLSRILIFIHPGSNKTGF